MIILTDMRNESFSKSAGKPIAHFRDLSQLSLVGTHFYRCAAPMPERVVENATLSIKVFSSFLGIF